MLTLAPCFGPCGGVQPPLEPPFALRQLRRVFLLTRATGHFERHRIISLAMFVVFRKFDKGVGTEWIGRCGQIRENLHRRGIAP